MNSTASHSLGSAVGDSLTRVSAVNPSRAWCAQGTAIDAAAGSAATLRLPLPPLPHRYLSMMETRVLLGTAPMTVSSFCPFLKIITVGMLRMPYSVATPGDSSVFSFSCGLQEAGQKEGDRAVVRPNQRSGPGLPQRRQPRCFVLPRHVAHGVSAREVLRQLPAALAPLPPPDRCLSP